jgi:hypothetical protein
MPFEYFYTFDHLPTGTTGRDWAQGDGALEAVNTNSVTQVYAVGHRWLGGNFNAQPLCRIAVPDLEELVVGFLWRRNDTNDSTPAPFVELRNVANAMQLNLFRNGTDILVRRGGTTLHTVSGFTFNPDTNYYVELSCRIGDTEGDWVLRINGEELASGSSENTGTGLIRAIQFNVKGATVTRGYFSRIYIRERPEGQDGFYGPLAFSLLNPTADVVADWVPDSGVDNYARVQAPADSGSYVESDTVGDVDEYELADLPSGANSIVAMVRVSVSFAPLGGAPQIEHGFKRGATEAYGVERTVGVGGGRSQATAFVTQPNGSPWSVAAAEEVTILRRSA